jgi:hypothetical protein
MRSMFSGKLLVQIEAHPLLSASPKWPMKGRNHVIIGMGDHTMQNGKRCTAASITALLEPPEAREVSAWSGDSSNSSSSTARAVSSSGEGAATVATIEERICLLQSHLVSAIFPLMQEN